MRTYVDIPERDIQVWRTRARQLGDPLCPGLGPLGPLAHSIETPVRLAHTNAWRVFFQVPDSPVGILP